MLRLLPLALLALALSAARCAGDRPPPDPVPAPPPLAPGPPVPPPDQLPPALGRPFIFVEGDSASFDGLHVTFVEAMENSRCPPDQECVWPGRAIVRLVLRQGDTTAEALPEIMGISDEPIPLDTLGHRFSLQALTYYPAPSTPGVRSTPIATVLIERL